MSPRVLDTYREALAVYRHHPLALLGPGLLFFAVAGVPGALLERVELHTALEIAGVVVAQLSGVVVSFLDYGYCEEVARQSRRGPVSTRRALADTLAVLPGLIGVAVLAGVGIAAGLLLLILPGLWLGVRWAVASPVASYEHLGPVRSLRRSHALVRGHVRFVLLTAVAAAAVQQGLSSAGDLVGAVIGTHTLATGLVEDVLVDVLVAPFSGLVVAGAYVRLAGAGQPAA